MPPSPSTGLCFHRVLFGLRGVLRSGLAGLGPNGIGPVLLNTGSCRLLGGRAGDEGRRLGLNVFALSLAPDFIQEGEWVGEVEREIELAPSAWVTDAGS